MLKRLFIFVVLVGLFNTIDVKAGWWSRKRAKEEEKESDKKTKRRKRLKEVSEKVKKVGKKVVDEGMEELGRGGVFR